MNTLDQYVNEVLHYVSVRPEERQRIEADLRAHLAEAVGAGEPLQTVLGRMGSPQEVAAAFMSEERLAYAGFWIRLAAFAIDAVVMAVPVLVFGGAAVGLSNLVPRQPAAIGDYAFGAVIILVLIACLLVAFSTFLLYFPILEGRFGQTLGKRLLGLRVLKENGLPIGYREAFLRRVSFYFDFFPFDALFIPFTAKHQRAFDIIARTVVVRVGASPRDIIR